MKQVIRRFESAQTPCSWPVLRNLSGAVSTKHGGVGSTPSQAT